MKKRMLVSVALGIGAFALSAGLAMAGSAPGSGIIGSLHDLSDDGGYPVVNPDQLSRVCIFCHAPHHTQKPNLADESTSYLPLWNRPVSQATSFKLYSNGGNPGHGPHMSQAMSDIMFNNIQEPGGVSQLCLSCHDGTVALNVYGSPNMSNSSWNPNSGAREYPIGSIGVDNYTNPAPSDPTAAYLTGQYSIGYTGNGTTDLSNHHPIGFDYTVVEAADNEIATVDTEFGTTGVKIADVLYNDQMECVTCHDVHNSTQGMGEKFLWTSNQDSAFCCTCHLKCGNPK